MTETMKTCSRCKALKPIESFYKKKKDGHSRVPHCIECQRIILHNYKQTPKGREKVKEIFRIRYINKSSEYIDKALQRRKEKSTEARASDRARYALKKGIIQKKPCVVCGSEKAEMHHRDYTKPIDVTWLCRSCHMLEHYNQMKGACRNGRTGN